MEFKGKFKVFYDKCLSDLKRRPDYTDAWLPMLDRFVMISHKAAQLGEYIFQEEVTVQHTNRAEKTNEVTSPKWRMYLLLDKQSNSLARELRLAPINSQVIEVEEEEEVLDLRMKIAK